MARAIIIGLLITARLHLLLVYPIVLRILGLRRGLVALLTTAAAMLPFWPIPAARFGTNTSAQIGAAAMLLFSCFAAWRFRARTHLLFSIGLVLLIPPFWSSCNAQHVLFALPFLAEGLRRPS